MNHSDIHSTWQSIQRAAVDRCESLQPPVQPNDLNALKSLGFPLPSSLVESLTLHDGESDAENCLLPGNCRLLSAREMVDFHQVALEAEDDYAYRDEFIDDGDRELGPIRPVHDRRQRLVFAGDEELAFALDFAPAEGGHSGQVIRFSDYQDGEVVVAKDYAGFLALVADGLETGSLPAQDSEENWNAWPPVAELPALRNPDFELLLRAGKITQEWPAIRTLADSIKPPLSAVEWALIEAHSVLDEAEFEHVFPQLDRLEGADRYDERIVSVHQELLAMAGRNDDALTLLTRAIDRKPTARLYRLRGLAHAQMANPMPFAGDMAEQLRWLASPAGQQHEASCLVHAVNDFRRALEIEERLSWRFELGEILLDARRWDEAAALFEALIDRLGKDVDGNSGHLEAARENLARAQARGSDDEAEGEDLLSTLDEAIEAMRAIEDVPGLDDHPDRELVELRDTVAAMLQDQADQEALLEEHPEQIDQAVEEVVQTLANLHADDPERLAPFPDADIDAESRRWLDRAERELGTHGFRALGTVELVRHTQVNGQRVPIRIMVSADERTMAAAWRLEGLFQAMEVVDLESALIDGRILITNNTGTADPFAPPAGVERVELPLKTGLGRLWAVHAERLADTEARPLPDLQAAEALQESLRLKKREDARAMGWVTDAELRSLLGGAYEELADQVRAKLDSLLG